MNPIIPTNHNQPQKSSIPILIAVIGLGLWTALFQCTGFHHQKQTEAFWTRTSPGTFTYKDRWIRLDFTPREGAFFDWAFYNLTDRPMEIPGETLILFRGEDPTPYTPWGKALGKGPKPGSIFIKPKGFVKFSYPVQANSPFFPFRTDPRPRLWMQVRIGNHGRSYVLYFPAEP